MPAQPPFSTPTLSPMRARSDLVTMVRSRSAAEQYLARGFKNLYNLTGGIDAWSLQIDPSVPRY